MKNLESMSREDLIAEVKRLRLLLTPKNQHLLIDTTMIEFGLKNDAAVAKFLRLPAPTVCRLRLRDAFITSGQKLVWHEKTGWPIKDIERMAAI